MLKFSLFINISCFFQVTNVYMSSSAKNFSKWIALGDSLTLPQSLSALAFNPQTHNLIMLYDLVSKSIIMFACLEHTCNAFVCDFKNND